MPSPTPKWPHGRPAAITLTLDNMGEAADLDRNLLPPSHQIGSHFSVTTALPKILSLLQKYDIKATYFIETWNLDVYPEMVRRVGEEGHEVAWHAFRHENWGQFRDDETGERENFERGFGGMRAFVEGEEGKGVVGMYRGFRPPGGVVNGERTLGMCREFGLEYVSPAGEEAAVVSVGEQKMVVLPFRWRMVDAFYYMEAFGKLRMIKGEAGQEVLSPDELAWKYIEGIDETIEKGGYLSMLFHPFLTDSEEKLEAMETVMQYLVQKRDEGKIWLARCRDVADYLKQSPETVGQDPQWDTTTWR